MAEFGYNIDTSTIGYEQALEAMRYSGASHHLLMFAPNNFFLGQGDVETIRKYLNALPHCTFIVRVWHRNEGNWKNYPAATQYGEHWAWVRSQLGDTLIKRVVFDDPVNEPNLGGTDLALAQAYVARSIQLVEAAASARVKLAVGAFSVGTPHESFLTTVYAPLWKAIAKHKQAISWHLYGAIPSEAGELSNLDIVLNAKEARNHMSKGRWPIDFEGWFIARSFRVIEFFRKQGLGVPEIYVTECLVDNIFNSQSSHIKDAWRNIYGIDKYQDDPRGVQTYERYLKEMFPEKSFEEAVAFLLDHARQNIFWHPAFKALCLFALNWNWGYPNGSNKEAGSNYMDSQFTRFRRELLGQLNAKPLEVSAPTTPAPIPDSGLITKAIRATDTATNWRQFPNTIAAIIGTIRDWTMASVSVDYATREWVKVVINGKVGYCAARFLTVADSIPTPQPEVPKTYTISISGLDEASAKLILLALQTAKIA